MAGKVSSWMCPRASFCAYRAAVSRPDHPCRSKRKRARKIQIDRKTKGKLGSVTDRETDRERENERSDSDAMTS